MVKITTAAGGVTSGSTYVGDSDGNIKVFKIEQELLMVSQLTDSDQCVYTAPPELPSFSDMKDSDDEGFSNRQEDEEHLVFNTIAYLSVLDFLDYNVDHLSMYLDVADPESLPCWSGYAQFTLTVNNQLQSEKLLMVSQLTDSDQCVYTAPPELPSFSDMKDSDDEGFSNCLNGWIPCQRCNLFGVERCSKEILR
ncbi:uncharacterized protein LOC120148708 [Hibiscus syriacus]|uniref:uncharacterized protein LOC120148706 n=1 Tax=Hibiscus syriacus TaxID=106335 RepID=UPI001920F733|nr:uncharacterized protein LOC120148706 [Hibiscus syriacus]XP_039017675.1 uncharacterized protein LOC120148708 [Hibiscus syriacus]